VTERDELDSLRAERAIARVILCYARAVDALDFERLRNCFHPDARIVYGSLFEGRRDAAIAWLEDSLTRLPSTLHDFGAPWIELDLGANRARCETCTTNAARHPPNERGEVVLSLTGARYVDVFERRDGEWRILERRNEVRWTLNAIETAPPPAPFASGAPRLR
jgi:hypothetical protein